MTPSEWILSIEGTPAGAQAALALALFSALAHATLGALQKGRHDPWLSRGAIDFWRPGAISFYTRSTRRHCGRFSPPVSR